jgi:hypothetical protein
VPSKRAIERGGQAQADEAALVGDAHRIGRRARLTDAREVVVSVALHRALVAEDALTVRSGDVARADVAVSNPRREAGATGRLARRMWGLCHAVRVLDAGQIRATVDLGTRTQILSTAYAILVDAGIVAPSLDQRRNAHGRIHGGLRVDHPRVVMLALVQAGQVVLTTSQRAQRREPAERAAH